MKKIKRKIIRVSIGAAIYLAALLINVEPFWPNLLLFLAAYLVIGGDILWRAVRNIFHGQVFDENFLMSIASGGAFFISEYAEAVAVMLFYQVGEMFQSYAVNKSRRSITELMDIRPDYANVRRDGEISSIDPDLVQLGETIVIRPGERVPLDAVIIEGSSLLDTVALTGESMPREVCPGSTVLSGCVNLQGLLIAETTKEFGESTASRILDLVENASSNKAVAENFISKFARYYTPLVVIIAALLAVLPPLLIAGELFTDWLYRALVFLVISCPCALVISVPLSFFGGIGAASKQGILVKGSNYLEALSQTNTVVFDKTGTLTEGKFKVQKIVPRNISSEEMLELAAYAEHHSPHPISFSLLEAYGGEIDGSRIASVQELAGFGVRAVVDGREILLGNERLLRQNDISLPAEIAEIGTIVLMALEGEYAGYILIADEIKADAAAAVADIKAAGVKNTVMLSGDNQAIAEAVAEQLDIDRVYAQLLPADKLEKLEELLEQKQRRGKLAFVGDGLNDAPVLARADIGIAMGALGADAAIEAADIVIMTDEPSKIARAIRLSRRTLGIVRQNIVFALGIKFAILALGTLGFANMWQAVFADVGVAFLAILNAMRLLVVKKTP
jgi:Cd2+/Zn2+-exporting ATPase